MENPNWYLYNTQDFILPIGLFVNKQRKYTFDESIQYLSIHSLNTYVHLCC